MHTVDVLIVLLLMAGSALSSASVVLAWQERKHRPVSSGCKALVFEMLADLVEYAADSRFDELAHGAEFTSIDRGMLWELGHKAREVSRIGARVMEQ